MSNDDRRNRVIQLFEDVKQGKIDEISSVISKHGAINVMRIRDGNHDSLLHVAALHGQVDVIKYLVENGFDIELKGHLGRTALLSAAYKGQSKAVIRLMSLGAKIDARSSHEDDNSTAVHLAVAFGHLETVDTLLEYKKNLIEAVDNDGDQPIHRAAIMDQPKCLEHLAARGANLEAKGQFSRTPFLCAVARGAKDAVLKLVKLGSNIHAVSDKEDGEGSAIHLACEFGHVDMISYLLAINPDFMNTRDSNNNLPINASALAGRCESIDFLLEKGANLESPGFNGRTPLLNATGKGNTAMMAYLLHDLKANASAQSGPEDDHATAIHIAAAFGVTNAIDLLLNTYSNFSEVTNGNGDLAIHVAAVNGQNEVIRVLLKHKALIEAKGYEERTPLLSAAAAGNVATVQLLLDKGARLSAVTNDESCNESALHLAAYFGHFEVVRLLGRLKPKMLTSTNSARETPYQRALANGHEEIAEWIKKAR